MVNYLEIETFFLLNQLNISKMARRPDFGKHWITKTNVRKKESEFFKPENRRTWKPEKLTAVDSRWVFISTSLALPMWALTQSNDRPIFVVYKFI